MQSKPKIYLDIDGTIIHEELKKYNQPANYLKEFFEALLPYDVYWMTTHCRDGNPTHAQFHLQRILSPELVQYIFRFKPTKWKTLKTEAMDFSSDFIWFDNDIFTDEREVLKKHNALSKIVEVNLIENPDQLQEIVNNVL